MKPLPILSLGLITIFLSSCSTAPRQDDPAAINRVLTETFAPIYNLSILRGGALDVIYCSASFRYKNDRWPKDYAELTAFVKQSEGYLILGEYERVNLKPLPDDGLEIGCVRAGRTNEMKFRLGAPAGKK